MSMLHRGSSLGRDSRGKGREGLRMLKGWLLRRLPRQLLRRRLCRLRLLCLLRCEEGLLLCECLGTEKHCLFLRTGRVRSRSLLRRMRGPVLLLRPSIILATEGPLPIGRELRLPPWVLLLSLRCPGNGRGCGGADTGRA